MTDVDLDSGSTHSFQDGVLAQIRTGDHVSHLGQCDCDRAHSRPADSDDVQPVRDRQIERRARRLDRRQGGLGERVDRALQLGGEDRRRHDGVDARATRSIKPAKAPER